MEALAAAVEDRGIGSRVRSRALRGISRITADKGDVPGDFESSAALRFPGSRKDVFGRIGPGGNVDRRTRHGVAQSRGERRRGIPRKSLAGGRTAGLHIIGPRERVGVEFEGLAHQACLLEAVVVGESADNAVVGPDGRSVVLRAVTERERQSALDGEPADRNAQRGPFGEVQPSVEAQHERVDAVVDRHGALCGVDGESAGHGAAADRSLLGRSDRELADGDVVRFDGQFQHRRQRLERKLHPVLFGGVHRIGEHRDAGRVDTVVDRLFGLNTESTVHRGTLVIGAYGPAGREVRRQQVVAVGEFGRRTSRFGDERIEFVAADHLDLVAGLPVGQSRRAVDGRQDAESVAAAAGRRIVVRTACHRQRKTCQRNGESK